MANYSEPFNTEQAAENKKINTVKHLKQVTRLLEMGFSHPQAEGLLEMGIKPDVQVKTVFRETIPGNRYSGVVTLHKDEESWLEHE